MCPLDLPPSRTYAAAAPAARRGMMLGAVLLATSSLGVSPPPPPPPPSETLCAEIVPGSSNAYQQSPGDWHFSLTFKVHWWVPKMHISIAFGEPVQISQVTGGASQVFYGPGAPSCLELPTVPSHTVPCVPRTAHCPLRAASSSGREFRRGRAGRGSSQLGFSICGAGLGDQQHEPGNHVHVRLLAPYSGCWPSAQCTAARRVAGITGRHRPPRRTGWTATQSHATPYGKRH